MRYRVCYADTDRMDRVYYANYLVFCERARTELLRDAGIPYKNLEQDGFFLPVRSCQIRYYGYAEYDDELEFSTWVTRLKHATSTFTTSIARVSGEVLVEAAVELACVTSEGKPQPFPETAVAALYNFRVEK